MVCGACTWLLGTSVPRSQRRRLARWTFQPCCCMTVETAIPSSTTLSRQPRNIDRTVFLRASCGQGMHNCWTTPLPVGGCCTRQMTHSLLMRQTCRTRVLRTTTPSGQARLARPCSSGDFTAAPLAEQVWVDLTEQVDCATSVENEEAIQQSLDDLSDQFIEFREDNIDNPVASAMRYSLPATLQTDVLKEQIKQFRAHRQ